MSPGTQGGQIDCSSLFRQFSETNKKDEVSRHTQDLISDMAEHSASDLFSLSQINAKQDFSSFRVSFDCQPLHQHKYMLSLCPLTVWFKTLVPCFSKFLQHDCLKRKS